MVSPALLPRSAPATDRPRGRRALINAEQHAFAFLPQVDLPIQVENPGYFSVQPLQSCQRVRDEVVMLHRRYGQIEPRHEANLFGP